MKYSMHKQQFLLEALIRHYLVSGKPNIRIPDT